MQGFLHAPSQEESPALLVVFDPRHEALLLACVTGLFLAQTALPASTFELLFHIKSEPNSLGSPGPCSSLQLGHLLLMAVLSAWSCCKQSWQ